MPNSAAWIGDNNRQGLGVFGFGDYTVELDESFDSGLTWIAPVRVSGPVEFHLLAICVLPADTRTSLRPILTALDVYVDSLPPGSTVVDGDFNHNVYWDTPTHPNRHAETVDKLNSMGMVSAYHESRSVAQGAEPEPTSFWRRKREDPYHIDYCFVPSRWPILEHSIGDPERWWD